MELGVRSALARRLAGQRVVQAGSALVQGGDPGRRAVPGVPRLLGVQRGDGWGVPPMGGGQAGHHPAGVGGAPGTAPGHNGEGL
ncbi:hypothetical protein [Streptomyces griseoluteus]|uniref:hypothetical protein n=1 Tax=Streptomyces griseoluteus TaxID=29306 RepID=UPI0036F793C1